MNTELPALMAMCVVWDAVSLGQKSSEDLASAVSVILQSSIIIKYGPFTCKKLLSRSRP